MTHHSPNSDSTLERCQHRTRTGRQCRSLAADANSSFCAVHAASEPCDSADFAAALTSHSYDFQRPQGVNNSLGALYNLLAQGRISPRRASVLAYISSLLLRTLPAIEDYHKNYEDDDDIDLQPVPPGKDPLPATAAEFAAAVLNGSTNVVAGL